jgi:hypothetical protein
LDEHWHWQVQTAAKKYLHLSCRVDAAAAVAAVAADHMHSKMGFWQQAMTMWRQIFLKK